jgi:tetratricopeptide (TPR) repeat protein
LFLNKAFTKKLIKKIVLTFLVIIIAGFLTIPINYIRAGNGYELNSFIQKVSFDSDEGDVSATNRLDFWKGSIKLFFDNPLFGTGPASFQYVFPKYQTSFLGNSNSPHNLFLKILVENGIFAMIFFILFLFFLLIRFLKVFRFISKKDNFILFIFLFSVLGSLLHNMIDYNLNFVSTFLLLFIFLGMFSSIINKYSKDYTISFKMLQLKKIIFLIIGIMMFFVSMHEVYYSYIFKRARAFHKNSNYEAAIIDYEKARNIFLKRDLFITYAQMYDKRYKNAGDNKDLEKAENLLLEALKLNKHDAFLVNYLGDIYYKMHQFQKAGSYYKKALELDPKNNLDYYYDVLKIDDNLEKQEIDHILDILSNYQKQLSHNAHLTILTGNPDSALMIYELLLRKLGDPKILEAKNRMEETYILEKEKFEKYYDLKLKKEED